MSYQCRQIENQLRSSVAGIMNVVTAQTEYNWTPRVLTVELKWSTRELNHSGTGFCLALVSICRWRVYISSFHIWLKFAPHEMRVGRNAFEWINSATGMYCWLRYICLAPVEVYIYRRRKANIGSTQNKWACPSSVWLHRNLQRIWTTTILNIITRTANPVH